MNRRTTIILTLGILFWGVPVALGLYTDWLWFADLGFTGVYRIRLLTQVALFAAGAAVFLGLVLGSAVLARRLSERAADDLALPGSQLRAIEGSFTQLLGAGALLLGLTMAGSMAGRWSEVLRFLRPTPFGTSDPLFGRDIAYFVFALPLYRFLQGWLLLSVFFALLAALAVYAFRLVLPQIPVDAGTGEPSQPRASFRQVLTRPMRAHLFGLGALLLALVAWGHRLSSTNSCTRREGRRSARATPTSSPVCPRGGSSSPSPSSPRCCCSSRSPGGDYDSPPRRPLSGSAVQSSWAGSTPQ